MIHQLVRVSVSVKLGIKVMDTNGDVSHVTEQIRVRVN